MLEFHQKFVENFYNAGDMFVDIIRQIIPYLTLLACLIPIAFFISIIPLLITDSLLNFKDNLRQRLKK